MEKEDTVMVIKDNRPIFLTVEKIYEHPTEGEVVLTEENRGYILKVDCYTKEQIIGMFDSHHDGVEEVDEDE